MIIEFSVENYRSIREEQKLSFVASNYEKVHPKNVVSMDVPGLPSLKLLKSAILYGANASGKTNVLMALDAMKTAVLKSFHLKPEQDIPTNPFRLDKESALKPSKFDMHFVMDEIHWNYMFCLDSKRIVEENLSNYPKGRKVRIFERHYDEDKDKFNYYLGSDLREYSDVKDKTRQNALFVSTAAQFDHPTMKNLFKWFSNIRWIESSSALLETLKLLSDKQTHENYLTSALTGADFGITYVEVVEAEETEIEQIPDEDREAFNHLRKFFEAIEKSRGKDAVSRLEAKIFHRMADSDEETAFDLDDESAGTQRFFSLLGPWLNASRLGRTILVDEIDRSLHPLLSRWLINNFHEYKDSNGAQLLMTTHDTTLLDLDLFRRDQIWFTEKNNDTGATILYPLSDFHPRKGEALQKGYLAGRYGAIPMLGANLGLDEPQEAK